MAEEGQRGLALPAGKVLALACIYLVTLSLSLVGSGSVLAMVILRRRCCADQVCGVTFTCKGVLTQKLRPLVLLSLADFLAALVLILTTAVQLLPAGLFPGADGVCFYGLRLGMTLYTTSLLLVLVYAHEVNRALGGWRATQHSNLQETRGPCLPRLLPAQLYALAWLLPFLVALALHGGVWSIRALRPLVSSAPRADNSSSSGDSGRSCASCLILAQLPQDTCFQENRKDISKESTVLFFVFVAVVTSCCMVLYCRVRSWQCRSHGAHLPVLLNSGYTSSRHYFQLVPVICWMPACLFTFLSFTNLQPSSLFPLSVATALTVPLQGFLHSLIYGWLRWSFRQEVASERLPLHCSPDLKAFYDDSLAESSQG